MRFSSSLSGALNGVFLKNSLKGRKRFPLVLERQLSHRCNLHCAGCDRIRLHSTGSFQDLSVDECLEAVADSRAPVITVTGGEPSFSRGAE